MDPHLSLLAILVLAIAFIFRKRAGKGILDLLLSILRRDLVVVILSTQTRRKNIWAPESHKHLVYSVVSGHQPVGILGVVLLCGDPSFPSLTRRSDQPTSTARLSIEIQDDLTFLAG